MRLRNLLVLFALSLSACRATRPPGLEDEIEQAARVLEQRFRAGDPLGLADLYADDALVVSADGLRLEGREEIDAFWSQLEGPIDARVELHDVGGSSDLAWSRSSSYRTVEGPGERAGTAATSVEDVLRVWRREERGWRIVVEVRF